MSEKQVKKYKRITNRLTKKQTIFIGKTVNTQFMQYILSMTLINRLYFCYRVVFKKFDIEGLKTNAPDKNKN